MTVIPFPGGPLSTDPSASRCVIGRRPHPATDGHLCDDHVQELGRWLHDVEAEATMLSAAPRMETRYDTGGGGLASQMSPVVLEAVAFGDVRTTRVGHRRAGPECAWVRCGHPSCWDIRSDRDEYESGGDRLASIVATLVGWADMVREGRGLTVPEGDVITPIVGADGAIVGEWRRRITLPKTVLTERRLLTRQLGWIAEQGWVVAFRAEIGDLRRDLMRLNRNRDPDPLPGYCYRIVDGSECRGDLWPTEPTHTTGYESTDGTRAVVCSRNDTHRWEGDDLPRLLVIVDTQRKDTAS